jgi:hypothetical protein
VSECVGDEPTEIGVRGLDGPTGIGRKGRIGCAVGCEYGDPLVADWEETDSPVHGVGDGGLSPELPVNLGMGEGVGGGVKAEVSQVVRFPAERELADCGVDPVSSNDDIAGPACPIGERGRDLAGSLVQGLHRASVALHYPLAESLVQGEREVAAEQADQPAVE